MHQDITDISSVEFGEPAVEDIGLREAPEGVDPALWKIWEDEALVRQDKFLWTLKRGLSGLNVGYDNGRTHINKYLHGTHKARYYLIGAESGAGKTTIADFMYVLKLWEAARKMSRRVKILYMSYEIGRVDKLYRWCSYFIFHRHGIRLPADYLQGQIQGRIPTDAHVKLILEAYAEIKGILERREIIIVEDVKHPTAIFESVVEDVFASYGTVVREPVSAEDAARGRRGYIKGYTEGDEEIFVELVVDHLALTGSEMGLDTKGVMDKMSKYAIVLRNLFGCSSAFIQQFSTDMMSAYRNNYGRKDAGAIKPTRLDFGDSKATYRDADIVLGYVKPQNEMDDFYGYNLKPPPQGLGQYFVAEYIMKNRYGPSGRLLPLFVDYVSGYCADLPLDPRDSAAITPFLEHAKQIEQVCQDYSPMTS
jgi:hypothetical protein